MSAVKFIIDVVIIYSVKIWCKVVILVQQYMEYYY